MRFHLYVDLGNDDMQSSKDLAQALIQVAERIGRTEYVESVREWGEHITRGITNTNGNSVGQWTLETMEAGE